MTVIPDNVYCKLPDITSIWFGNQKQEKAAPLLSERSL
jgi:hypothetical protein